MLHRSTSSTTPASPRRSSIGHHRSDSLHQPRRRASMADMQQQFDRSPRHSLAPEPMRGARYSLTPEAALRIPGRSSLTPEYGSRLSLNPQDFNKSPRNSLTPDASARSPRRSLVPDNVVYQSRSSLTPEVARSPRHSVANIHVDSYRGCHSAMATPRTSPRGSLIPDESRSAGRSPRGSIAIAERGSRGIISTIDHDVQKISPRSSMTLTFQEPLVSRERRASDESGNQANRGRNISPYRSSITGGTSRTGYGCSAGPESGSRRASSSVSQVSGDEQKRLCSEHNKYLESGGLSLGAGLTTYGSVAYQLKDANMEASGTFDFVCRAIRIMNRTVLMTVFLACISTLPLVMLIMGVQYIRDCPAEPHLPVYMVVGGALGGVRIAWLLWSQLAARTPGVPQNENSSSVPEQIASILLWIFVIAWFGLGNFWTLHIFWPDNQPTLFEPNKWCHRTLYVFALSHLVVVWSIVLLLVILIFSLACCQAFGCGWLGSSRFK